MAVIIGTNGNDILVGTSGNDLLRGGYGNDTLSGGIGDDIIYGGYGNDSIDGGNGFDIAAYDTSPSGVTVSLASILPQNTLSVGWDTLSNMEGIIGSNYDDVLTAGPFLFSNYWHHGDIFVDSFLSGGLLGNDTLNGGSGNDVLRGGYGTDTLYAGEGAVNILYGGYGDDHINGGNGLDIAAYDTSPSGVTVSLDMANESQNTGSVGWDTLDENMDGLSGSHFNDTLTASGYLPSTLIGLQGNDTLVSSYNGNNTFVFNLSVMDGHDTIVGFVGDDILEFTTDGHTVGSVEDVDAMIAVVGGFSGNGTHTLVTFNNGASIDFQGIAFDNQTSIEHIISPFFANTIETGDLYFTQLAVMPF